MTTVSCVLDRASLGSVMLFALNPIPFTAENYDFEGIHSGFSIVHGLLIAEARELVIEHRRYSVLGQAMEELREARIPLEDVVHLRLEKRWYSRKGTIELRVRTHRHLESVPVSAHGSLRVTVARADFEDAERFCLEVSQAVLRLRTERLVERFGDDEL